jgi:hypothetical protein
VYASTKGLSSESPNSVKLLGDWRLFGSVTSKEFSTAELNMKKVYVESAENLASSVFHLLLL